MPATLNPPTSAAPVARAAVKLPPGARKPFVADPPEPCYECGGLAPDPDFEAPCGRCKGVGVERAFVKMPPARTDRFRRAIYTPDGANSGRLQLATARSKFGKMTTDSYTVAEFAVQESGRGFAVHKDGEPEPYHLLCGPSEVRCDCPGFEYLAAAKANQAAHGAGEQVFVGYGCRHADATVALLLGRWFDL